MSRSLRVNYNDAWYHVMNRGAGFREIFLSNKDRNFFLTLLGEITEQYNIEIHAYCLMKNHYHLLLKTPKGNVSEAIRHLNGLYARYFNRERKTDGPLFRSRFKSTIVSNDEYLIHVSRYIHLNPVRANMVKMAEEYQWSSCSLYLNISRAPSWCFTDKILGCFTGQDKTYQYKKFVGSENKKKSR